MSKYRIVSTTDNRYLGRVFDSADNPIQLADDVFIFIDKQLQLTDRARFFNSNYIIDAVAEAEWQK